MAFVSREQLLELLRDPRAEKGFEVSLGENHPSAVVRNEDDGLWVIRELQIDEPAARKAGEAALAAGESWMPEHVDAFKRPAQVVVSGASAAELASAIETIDWRWDSRGLEAAWFADYRELLLAG